MEKSILKTLRIVILALILLTLTTAVTYAVKSAINWLESPKEPKPAEVATVREVKIEDLVLHLESLAQQEADANKKKPMPPVLDSLKYLEEGTVLYRCAENFGAVVGSELAVENDQVNSAQLERLRSQLEIYARATSWHSDRWVKTVVTFVCDALKNEKIIELRKQEKLKQVFFPIIEFHNRAWDKAFREKSDFDNKEKMRVVAEKAAEELRVGVAKATAYAQFSVSIGALVTFIMLALCLILIKIETDLVAIARNTQPLPSKP